jgi:hypothetical protein
MLADRGCCARSQHEPCRVMAHLAGWWRPGWLRTAAWGSGSWPPGTAMEMPQETGTGTPRETAKGTEAETAKGTEMGTAMLSVTATGTPQELGTAGKATQRRTAAAQTGRSRLSAACGVATTRAARASTRTYTARSQRPLLGTLQGGIHKTPYARTHVHVGRPVARAGGLIEHQAGGARLQGAHATCNDKGGLEKVEANTSMAAGD